ncbi:MAG: hypothetical protein O7E52_11905 [Candidatus Poribacteria bacterium]|nr:hypothetical protein [Candidatus Poribacteria bacterium]
MYRKILGVFACITAISILVGCAPKPHVEIYMEPVAGKEEAQIDAQTGSITIEQKGVRITLEPLDEVELFELTEDARINPYIGIDRWGNVEPLYTVFGIRIENTDNQRVIVDPTAILIDQNGYQYASLPYDYFRDVYGNGGPQTVSNVGYRYYPYPGSYYHNPYHHYRYPYRYRYAYPPYRVYDYYPDPNAVNHARTVARETVFDGGRLFSGAKRDGLLVFDRLALGATDVKVILPEVLIVNQQKQRSKVKFEFDFRQIVNVEE